MADIYVRNAVVAPNTGTNRNNWLASTLYAVGDRVVGVAASNYWVYECTVGGTTAATEPAWVNTNGSATVSGTATFTARLPDTWANATTTLIKAAASDSAGDTIYVDSAFNDTTVGGVWFAGTAVLPTNVISVNSTTDTYQLQTGSAGYPSGYQGIGTVTGLTFTNGTNAVHTFSQDQTSLTFKDCTFRNLNNSTSTNLLLVSCGSVSANEVEVKLISCKFKSPSARLFSVVFSKLEVIDASIESGSPPNTILTLVGTCAVLLKDCDFATNVNSSIALLASTASQASGTVDVVNCKFPAGWNENIATLRPTMPGFALRLFNCLNGASVITYKKYCAAGDINFETTTVKTGGSQEGVTPSSWRMITTSTANELGNPLVSDVITIPSDTAGTFTLSIDVTSDVILTTADIWMEIDFQDGYVSTRRATVLTPATQISNSSATWSSGLANKQTLSAAITTARAGNVYVKVYVCRPSTTVVVDYAAYLA